MELVEYAEKTSSVPLTEWQKQFLQAYEKACDEGQVYIDVPPRISGRMMVQEIIRDYERSHAMKFCFGDIVVVDGDKIGVVVKSWVTYSGNKVIHNYDVYVRIYNEIKNYKEDEMERYMVRHKYLSEEELEYPTSAVLGI